MATPEQPTVVQSPHETILGLAFGYVLTRCLYIAASLGVADLLIHQPRNIEDIASTIGADTEALYRLLRCLAAHGVFTEATPRMFGLTPAANLLRTDIPGSLHPAVTMIGDLRWTAVGQLRQAVMTGIPAFDSAFGMGFFDRLSQYPEEGASFDRGMASFSASENPAIVAAYDFSQFKRVADIGGRQGGLLSAILTANQTLFGLLYDRPEVVLAPAYLEAAGVLNRCEVTGGNFFKSVPKGADAYILKRVLHDWSDDQCIRILRNCSDALKPEARILIIDAVVPEGDQSHPAKIMDVLMMALLEGRERTRAQFDNLMHRSGFTLTAIIPTRSVVSIVEGTKV